MPSASAPTRRAAGAAPASCAPAATSATVELESGPFRITAALTRDAVEELGLAAGVPATAAVEAISVMVVRA